jgi:hypothetical protein
MFHTHSRTWPFGSKVLGVDDNFDVVGLEKSIVKAADYEVLTGEQLGRHVTRWLKANASIIVFQQELAIRLIGWKFGQWPKSRLTFFELGPQHGCPRYFRHARLFG